MSSFLGGVGDPDLPRGWRPPAELTKPSTSYPGNLVARIVTADLVGNAVCEALGLYLAADARFNVWYGSGAGGGDPTDRELAELRAFSMDALGRVYEAWEAYRPKTGESAQQALLTTIRDVVAEYCSRMGETIGDFGNL